MQHPDLTMLLPFLQLAAAGLAGVLWDQDASRGWVVAIAVAPLALRLLVRRRPIPNTPLDLPIAVFLASAAVGLWVSYDPFGTRAASPWMPPAGHWISGLIVAAAVFYGIASLDHPTQVRWAMGLLAGLGAVGAIWFALTNDWVANLARVPGMGGLAAILARRPWPRLPLPPLSPNLTGGLLAMLCFYALGVAADGRGRVAGRWLWFVGGLLAALATALGLFLTASRGAWLAAVGAGALAVAWCVASWAARRADWGARRRLAVAVSVAVLLAVLGAALLLAVPELRVPLLDPTSSGTSRFEVYDESLVLARDYAFTGSGPGTFATIHSTYALLIHVPVLIHAHNMYLHVLVEQGLLGLAALIATIGVPAWLGLRRLASTPGINPLLLAALVSLAVEVLHGLVDYPLNGNRSLLFLWVPAGLTIAALRSNGASGLREHGNVQGPDGRPANRRAGKRANSRRLAAGMLLVAGLLLIAMNWRTVAAAWYANLGALAQTRAELTRYDYRHFGDPTLRRVRQDTDLSEAERLFRQALALDPANPTALARLGAIAFDRAHHEDALALLQAAWEAGHRDRVTRILYGDALVAAGRVDTALNVVGGLRFAQDRFLGEAWHYHLEGDTVRSGYARTAAEGLR